MKEMKFEDALKKLEEAVSKLEEGNLPLEDSLKLFEEGMSLVKACQKKLDEAETKIKTLTKSAGGKTELKEFEEDARQAE